tara:strand:- start:49 stop:660 length:612 start_codon:yes stop_codon:yes gene_type:complete
MINSQNHPYGVQIAGLGKLLADAVKKTNNQMKHKTLREWLDYRHPEQWEKLDDNTQEFLNNDGLYVNEHANQYATWHRAYTHSSDGFEFYQEASNDEIQAARNLLSEEDADLNPYTVMNAHNLHILRERCEKAIRGNLETLWEILDLDTWDRDSDLQKEVTELQDSAESFKEDHDVAEQLIAQSDYLNGQASEWLEYVTTLLK